jgi:Camelysin metallo-endopeptidase
MRYGRTIKSVAIVGFCIVSVTMVGGAVFAASLGQPKAFTTGSLELSVSPASAAVSFREMAPGDRVTAPITVRNDGTLSYRYSVTSFATNADSKALAGQLDLTIKTGVTTCTDRGFAADGTVLYGPGALGSVAGVGVIGDPLQGFQTGDRTLDAIEHEVLCVQVALPPGTRNAFQGASTTATFTFDAEQAAEPKPNSMDSSTM